MRHFIYLLPAGKLTEFSTYKRAMHVAEEIPRNVIFLSGNPKTRAVTILRRPIGISGEVIGDAVIRVTDVLRGCEYNLECP